jgi:hypothetical protein
MGGMYGPEYAGRQAILRDGLHGPAVCQRSADRRMRMICQYGHQGEVMDLCGWHANEIMRRMAECCTKCVWPEVARGVNEAMEWIMREMAVAREREDTHRLRLLGSQLDDQRHTMDELAARGIIRKVPMLLVEVS